MGLSHLTVYHGEKTGTREPEAEAMEECCLPAHAKLPDIVQTTGPGNGATHSRLSPPTSINNQDSFPTDMLTGQTLRLCASDYLMPSSHSFLGFLVVSLTFLTFLF